MMGYTRALPLHYSQGWLDTAEWWGSQDAWLGVKKRNNIERQKKRERKRESHLDAISLSEGKHLPHSSQAHWPTGVKGRDDKRVTQKP